MEERWVVIGWEGKPSQNRVDAGHEGEQRVKTQAHVEGEKGTILGLIEIDGALVSQGESESDWTR